jgi:hypothetical protein
MIYAIPATREAGAGRLQSEAGLRRNYSALVELKLTLKGLETRLKR